MNTHIVLQNQAIAAAKNQNWQQAVEVNQTILEHEPNDIGALNRLGVAHTQLGDLSAAKAVFNQVLEIDKSNSIAKKHLTRLKSNQVPASPSFSEIYFIEEPGKTKITELHRLAGKNVLDTLSVGHVCELKTKNRYVSVECGGVYVGALPEDLSFRLTKLIKGGNEYTSYIHSLSPNSCSIYIKETVRSEANQFIHSFPPSKSSLAAINELDEEFLLEDDIPVEVGENEMMDEAEEKPFEIHDNDE